MAAARRARLPDDLDQLCRAPEAAHKCSVGHVSSRRRAAGRAGCNHVAAPTAEERHPIDPVGLEAAFRRSIRRVDAPLGTRRQARSGVEERRRVSAPVGRRRPSLSHPPVPGREAFGPIPGSFPTTDRVIRRIAANTAGGLIRNGPACCCSWAGKAKAARSAASDGAPAVRAGMSRPRSVRGGRRDASGARGSGRAPTAPAPGDRGAFPCAAPSSDDRGPRGRHSVGARATQLTAVVDDVPRLKPRLHQARVGILAEEHLRHQRLGVGKLRADVVQQRLDGGVHRAPILDDDRLVDEPVRLRRNVGPRNEPRPPTGETGVASAT